MTETTTDAIARMQAVMEPVSKHLNGLHAEEFDESCIECHRYRLTVELEEARRELERLHGATVLVQCDSSDHAELDQLRAQRDALIEACYDADLDEDNFLTTPEIRAFFAEAVTANG